MNREKLNVHIERLLNSYEKATGSELIPIPSGAHVFQTIDQAPFALLSHGTEEDPVLNYGNRTALRLWEMDWNRFTSTPSRQTAEPANQEAREKLMADVRLRGYTDAASKSKMRLSGT